MMTIDAAVAHFRARYKVCDGITWLATQPDVETAWATCERPDWLLLAAEHCGVAQKTLMRIACQCARLALPLVPAGEERPRIAIETAEACNEGRAALSSVRLAAFGAYAVYSTAFDAYAIAPAATRSASAAVGYAAYAAHATIDADAAAAASCAAFAIAHATGNFKQANRQANIQMCAIIRRHISLAEVLP